MDLVDIEHVEAEGGPDDVHDRVYLSDLVESDLAQRLAMHACFRFTETMEDRTRGLLDRFGQRTAANDRQHVRKRAMWSVFVVRCVTLLIVMVMMVVVIVIFARNAHVQVQRNQSTLMNRPRVHRP